MTVELLPVAQLDNAADSDSEDRGFESLRADQNKKRISPQGLVPFLFFLHLLQGIRTRRERKRKKTVRWTVFADVGNER